MITINSGNLCAGINELGAELKSLQKDGKEYMWQGNPDIWSGSAPLMFPICGGLKDDKFILDGKEYFLQKHGFAKFKTFSIEKKGKESVTFLLKDDAETIKSYPFKFELRVIFTLTTTSLNITYKVKNINNKTMYFSIGSHEAYATPEGIEDYDVIFPQKETLNATILDGNLLEKNTFPIIKETNVLPLYDKYFLIDALVFKDLKSRSAMLRNRKTGKTVKVDFPDADYFLLWHKHGAGYMCLEPWCGVQDSQDSDYNIANKEGIRKLDKDEEQTFIHSITIL